jgi:hypothetical protein
MAWQSLWRPVFAQAQLIPLALGGVQAAWLLLPEQAQAIWPVCLQGGSLVLPGYAPAAWLVIELEEGFF